VIDIALCQNAKCRSCKLCHRFRAIPDPVQQVYADFKPRAGAGRCGDFMTAKRGEKLSKPS